MMAEEQKNKVHPVSDPGFFDMKVSQNSGKLVVVHFHAEWSVPSKDMVSCCQTLAELHKEVVFMRVDVEACEELARRHHVLVTPSFLFLKGGEELEVITGANRDKLEQLVIKFKK